MLNGFISLLNLLITACSHGVMVVGESGSGKSTAVNMLSKVLNKLAQQDSEYPVRCSTIAPKASRLSSLFGYFDDQSREWSEGLIGVEFKRLLNETNSHDNQNQIVRRLLT